jgi:hypothetical protein
MRRIAFTVILLVAANTGVGKDYENIIPMRQRVQLMESWWKWKLANVLPKVMREQKIEMWIVRNDEGELFFNDEGPVYTSLIPANYEGMAIPSQHVRPGSQETPRFLVFHDTGDKVDYLEPASYADITRIVRARDPKTLAIGDYDNERMIEALGDEYASRSVSSWTLGVRWLETMAPDQISAYRYVQGVANDIIAEGFSNRVVIPDVTTTDDLNWWFRQKMLDLDIEYENHPSIVVQRSPQNIARYGDPPEFFRRGRTRNGVNVTIRRGDVISCDTDIMLLGLTTDSHQHAYVLQHGETDVPQALKEALLKVNQMQDRFAREFQRGRTGIGIVQAAKRLPLEEGVIETKFGFHPPPMFIRRYLLGGFFFVTKPYVAGMTSGPGYYPTSIVTNKHRLHLNTLYAFEPHTRVAVPGWGEHGVELGIGQIAVFNETGLEYLDRPQATDWHVIR